MSRRASKYEQRDEWLTEPRAPGSDKVSTFGRRIKTDKESLSELEDDDSADEASVVEQEEEN